jgi:hypothetical protein
LAIDMSFVDSMDSWSPSPFSSSPCSPINYSGEQFAPVAAGPAPPTSAYDSYNNIMAQLDSCGGIGVVLSPATLGSDPLVAHLPDLQHDQQQHDPYPSSKGFATSFQFFSHKLPVPEVPDMDITGYTDMFASDQSFCY